MAEASLRTLLVAIVSTVALVLTAVPAAGVEDVQPARVAGETRLETAAAIADLAFPEGVDEAVVATSVTYPDALVGSALAGALDAAVLLNPPDVLASTTREALERLGVARVTILGSPASVSEDVAAELQEDYDVNRIGGDTLYQTAANVALATADVAGGLPDLGGQPTAFLASGEDFPDGLAASGPAYDAAFPLLLTRQDALPDDTAAAIDRLAPAQVVIFGGTEAVSSGVEQTVRDRGIAVIRLGGQNRMDTARIVADFFIDSGFFDARLAHLARGDNFPDALTAGTIAGAFDAAILLTASPELLSDETRAWFERRCDTIEVLRVVGGTAAVSVAVANDAESAAESCAGGTPGEPDIVVAPQEPRTEPPGETIDFTALPETGTSFRLALFPCENAEILGADPDTFADADGDGSADGLGSSDTDSAVITSLHGHDIEDRRALGDVSPDEEGHIEFGLRADAADCTVAVIWQDDGDGDLDVDDQGRPVERYGVGHATWEG